MAKKKWIQSAIKNKGALHKELGIPEKKKIPISIINKEEEKLKNKENLSSKERTTLKRLILAKTLRKLRK